MSKAIILLSLSILLFGACKNNNQRAKAPSAAGENARVFKLVSGDTDSSSAAFSLSGITVSFLNTPDSMQTILINGGGKRLVNYIREIDSTETFLPTPYLSIKGKDTMVSFSISHENKQTEFLFNIKNNKATHTKIVDTTYKKGRS
ncbi:hypothetical protein [Chitinophaga sp. MM2321]|uniref:hypothetical protein n=1 Tax=Chitinophaga sp. MM2321 TaxID=3137178 RepID=UPI0032D58F29